MGVPDLLQWINFMNKEEELVMMQGNGADMWVGVLSYHKVALGFIQN